MNNYNMDYFIILLAFIVYENLFWNHNYWNIRDINVSSQRVAVRESRYIV